MAYENAGRYWYTNPAPPPPPAPAAAPAAPTTSLADRQRRYEAEQRAWAARRRQFGYRGSQPPTEMQVPDWLQRMRDAQQGFVAAPTLNQLSGQQLVAGQPYIPRLNQTGYQLIGNQPYIPALNLTGRQLVPGQPYVNFQGQQMQPGGPSLQTSGFGMPSQFAQYARMQQPYHRDVPSQYPKVYIGGTVPSLPTQPSYSSGYGYPSFGGGGGGSYKAKVSAWARLVGWNVNRG